MSRSHLLRRWEKLCRSSRTTETDQKRPSKIHKDSSKSSHHFSHQNLNWEFILPEAVYAVLHDLIKVKRVEMKKGAISAREATTHTTT